MIDNLNNSLVLTFIYYKCKAKSIGNTETTLLECTFSEVCELMLLYLNK